MPTYFVWSHGIRGQRKAERLAHHNFSILVMEAQKVGILVQEGERPVICLGLTIAHSKSPFLLQTTALKQLCLRLLELSVFHGFPLHVVVVVFTTIGRGGSCQAHPPLPLHASP